MSEPIAPLVLILLFSALGLLVLLLGMGWTILRQLRRIERRLAMSLSRQEGAEATAPGDAAGGGTFEVFLNEDPTRRELTKSEQFAAYRRWRQERGLNWSNS